MGESEMHHLVGVKTLDQGGNIILHISPASELCFDSKEPDSYVFRVDMAQFYEAILKLRSNERLKELFSLIQWEKQPQPREVVTYEEAQLLLYCSDARNLQKLFVANSIESVERYNKDEYEKYSEDAENNSANIMEIDGQKRIVLVDHQLEGLEGWQEGFIFNLTEDCLEIVTRKLYNKGGKDKMIKKVIKR